MRFSSVVQSIRLSVATNVPALIAGPTGAGKTAAVGKAVGMPILDHMYQVRTMNVATADESDLVGMMSKSPDGKTSIFLRPEFIVDPDASYDQEPPVLYFLDEISRAPSQVRHALMPAVYPDVSGNRYIGTHRLRHLDRVVLAYNPASAGYDTEDLDPALVARCSHLVITPSIDEWQTWTAKEGFDSTFVQFMLIKAPNLAFDFKPRVEPTFRSMELAHRVYSFCKDAKEFTESVMVEFLSGLIGSHAHSLPAYLREHEVKPLSCDALLGMSKKEVEAYFKTLHDKNRHDIFSSVSDSVGACILSKTKTDEKDIRKIVGFLKLFPRDLTTSIVSRIVKEDLMVMNGWLNIDGCKEFVSEIWMLLSLPESKMQTKEKLLLEACKIGALEVAKLMVELGVDIEAFRDDLIYQATKFGHLHIVQYLFKPSYTEGTFPLSFAARFGHFHIVKYLVEKGVKIEGYPLKWAQDNGHHEIVKYLQSKVS